MTTITIDLDDDLAKHVEEAARREHKTVAEWVRGRMNPDVSAGVLALEAIAQTNGYPPEWTKLYASLADDESFVAPPRGECRPTPDLE